MQAVHVLAIITAKPGMRDKVLEAFRANVPAVHEETGCIEYTATIDSEDAGGLQIRLSSRSGRVSTRSRLMPQPHTWPPMPPGRET